ncbi:hypothetical protein [Roseicyclus sp.]|uniref:hypothetical protein n=1 Tax=Roseicyclus sp. TaxID=1914329 RepID=UPI003FA09640
MSGTRTLLRAAAPLLAWALHFSLVYALISAACAPRALMAPGTLAATVALLTAAGAIGMLALLVLAGRGLRRAEGADRALEQAAWWSALISLLAILANVWPIAILPGCTG